MTERTVADDRKQIVESVRNKARQENITIAEAARKLSIPIHRYYKFLGEMNKSQGQTASKTRRTKTAKRRVSRKVSQQSDGNGRRVNVRQRRDQSDALTKENAQLREELLDVLLENRHLRAQLDTQKS